MTEITDADKANPLWHKLQLILADRLDKLRRKNDGAMSESDTAKLRGQIAEIKWLMAMDKEKPIIE